MIETTRYHLKENPFVAIPQIEIDSDDERINGKLYCREVMGEKLDSLKRKIRAQAYPVIVVRSQSVSLGTGKSAFMAAAYRELEEEGQNVAWTTLSYDNKMKIMLMKLIGAIIESGKWKALIQAIVNKDTNLDMYLAKLIKARPEMYEAINQIIHEDIKDVIYTFSNIKRQVPSQDHIQLFGEFIALFRAIGIRFTFFIDQFEEYYKAHRSSADKIRFGQEFNDLMRKVGNETTIVFSVHADTIFQLTSISQDFSTFVKIEQTAIDLPEYDEEDLLLIAKSYFEHFRMPNYKGSSYYPFDENVIKYLILRTGKSPRQMIIALRLGLLSCSENECDKIDEKFLLNHHKDMFGGDENKWHEYLKGDLSWV